MKTRRTSRVEQHPAPSPPAEVPEYAVSDLLLSLVENHWASNNGSGGKMDHVRKAQHELEKIEQQIVQMEAAAAANPQTRHQLEELHKRVEALRRQIHYRPSAWEKTELARHPQRPHTVDYIERLFTDWSEIHGDRGFADDPAIIAGMARFHGEEVMVLGTEKGRDTKQKIFRNFGLPNPEGYRKALRAMKMAEKFSRPILIFVDVTGANPGLGAEERGQAEAIARNLREMARLRVPIISTITGEGGSGGALAIAVADRVLMMENAVYSVISPEGCASIMWRDSAKKELAAEALRITASDLRELGCIDDTIQEPEGGAHTDYDAATAMLDAALQKHLGEIRTLPTNSLLELRYSKFRNVAPFFTQ
ncbi:MAG TPA: acetyl-CoA carboxylase carboxyltransferase subunit alpha [Terriglobales bacterium]